MLGVCTKITFANIAIMFFCCLFFGVYFFGNFFKNLFKIRYSLCKFSECCFEFDYPIFVILFFCFCLFKFLAESNVFTDKFSVSLFVLNEFVCILYRFILRLFVNFNHIFADFLTIPYICRDFKIMFRVIRSRLMLLYTVDFLILFD